jgi:hypothetical protein
MENQEIFVVILRHNKQDYVNQSIVKFNIKLGDLLVSFRNKKQNKVLLFTGMDKAVIEQINKQKTLVVLESGEDQENNFNYPAENPNYVF